MSVRLLRCEKPVQFSITRLFNPDWLTNTLKLSTTFGALLLVDRLVGGKRHPPPSLYIVA